MAQGSLSEEDRDSPEDCRRVAERLAGSCEGLTTTVKQSYRPDGDLGSSLGIEPRFGRCDMSSPGVR
ncbi:hypothetical protein B296_00001234 [Ensete ventricosum]|uniref:Uncharacterized protein n=1 Tax=Ensete ventricosum TaxID=4639 RepID=A0A427AC13_ENSVE|nr:hypothetical protein B296_00001234 [Ensete ventricosum]